LDDGTFEIDTSEQDFADIAVFYTADWNSIKLSAAAAYTWIETGVNTVKSTADPDPSSDSGDDVDLFQVGASIMHKPSGLGIYGMYQHEETDARVFFCDVQGTTCGTSGSFQSGFFSIPDSDVWYVKPFWRKAWSPIGATVLYGEYGEYNDQFSSLAGVDLRNGGDGVTPACNGQVGGEDIDECFVRGSEVERWGLGVVQEIDSAAMHLWLRWQHQELDVDFTVFGEDQVGRRSSSFDDHDLFQAGGIIFF
jgi:hypothetical protein